MQLGFMKSSLKMLKDFSLNEVRIFHPRVVNCQPSQVISSPAVINQFVEIIRVVVPFLNPSASGLLSQGGFIKVSLFPKLSLKLFQQLGQKAEMA